MFDEHALTYQDIKQMDLAEFAECLAGKQLYMDEIERQREEAQAENE